MKAFLRTAMRCFALSSLLFASPFAWSGNLTIPNTFTAGNPAVAADVNANFAATETAVNSKQDLATAAGVEFVGFTSFSIPANGGTAATIAVTAPAAGFLIVTAYGNANCAVAGNFTAQLQNATTSTTTVSTFDTRATTAFQYYSVHTVFTVTAGVQTLNVLASCGVNTGFINVNTFSAIFIANRL